MYKHTSTCPWTFTNRKDPEELERRLNAFKNLIGEYIFLNSVNNKYQEDLSRVDINLTCKKPMDAVKEFINSTGAGYENIYSAITPDMVKLIKNTEL
jgi:hypothetical protein